MVSVPPPPPLATAAAAARGKRSERASRVGMEETPEHSGGSLFLDLHILHHYQLIYGFIFRYLFHI
jgi:hypothetical protein